MSVDYVIHAPPRRRSRLDLDRALNDAQRAVVLAAPGPMLVIAGAGSGKTRTLTYRAAYLLETGIDPTRMLLCTFTRRAAQAMVKQLEDLLDAPLHTLWAGTFHHVAHLALRRHARQVGLRDGYTILDQEDARDVLAATLGERPGAPIETHLPRVGLLQQLGSLAINQQWDLARAISVYAPRFLRRTEEITRILGAYQAKKQQLGLVDYDDLLRLFRQLLTEHDDIRASLTERFQHVLVDEYQDTNKLQGDLVDLCAGAHRNVMVVGDDAQSIYAFRGACFENIIAFPERYPDARVFLLERNYRSTPEILTLANAVIAHNTRQFKKQLSAVRPSGMTPALLPLSDVYQQCAFVAQRILELSQDEQVPLAEIAVLYRTHAQSIELQVELSRREIPYTIRSGLRYFEQAHIKDILGFLRLVHNAGDALAWQRVLKLWSGVGRQTQSRILSLVEAGEQQTSAEILSRVTREKVSSTARQSIARLSILLGELAAEPQIGAMIRRIVEGHYRDYASAAYVNAHTRLDDIAQLAAYAEHYEGLEAFLSEVALVAGFAGEGAKFGERPDDCLTLSTVHQAKGLEWRVVFILWLVEGRFPQGLSLGSPEELEEERRLFYVATTRAKDQLYLCQPRYDEQHEGARRLLRLSRFVVELGSEQPPYEAWQIRGADETPAG